MAVLLDAGKRGDIAVYAWNIGEYFVGEYVYSPIILATGCNELDPYTVVTDIGTAVYGFHYMLCRDKSRACT